MKTLVDEIRDIVGGSRTRGIYPAETDAACYLLGHECEGASAEAALFTKIAERIEREYLHRPRFEDGELVDVEDEIDVNGTRVKVKSYVVDDDGLTTFLDGKSTLGYDLEPGKPAKRWKHEVMDADGVPYRIGDTVWHVDDGTEGVVTDVRNGNPVIDGCIDFPLDWTHKQPDSLERVETDIAEWCIDHAVKGGMVPVNEWVERIKALLEMGKA